MQPPAIEDIKAAAKEMRPSIEKTASVNGWRLNDNADIADSVIEGLAYNKLMYGKRFCPCRIRSGDAEKDKLTICPCAYSKEDVERDGHCHCYLFVK